MGYTISAVEETEYFRRWIESVGDRTARARILMRIDRLIHGNPGLYRNLRQGVSELKVSSGPGYRVYYTIRQRRLLLLLAGGDKSSQSQDIERAIQLALACEET